MESHNLEKETSNITNLTSIPLPNPFKALTNQSAEQFPPGRSPKEPGRVALDDERDLAEIIAGSVPLGFRARSVGGKLLGISWSEQQLTAFEYELGYIRILYTDPVTGIKDLQWTRDSSYTMLFENRAEVYVVQLVDHDNDAVKGSGTFGWRANVTSRLIQTIALREYDAVDICSALRILTTSLSSSGTRSITTFDTGEIINLPRIIWQSDQSIPKSTQKAEITSLLPLELDIIVQGYNDGRLRQSSMLNMIGDSAKNSTSDKVSDLPLNGFVTALHLISNSSTKERLLVGGGDDGSVAFWTIDQFKLCARWILFTTCLSTVVPVLDTHESPLRGCALCVSTDGTVAVIAIDGFQLYVFLNQLPCATTKHEQLIPHTRLSCTFA
ncbi:hypothetical protein H0H81_000016 [Sphagnurus paluster]|uniref:Uncharacterized protein n=1 Tax=Sphagnurus paluster TaxID=117069 RepID=A0A9P7K9D0_9AGAR|nr:hypothetical protein H0H81_000016 [Sphagnurus paluster]